MPLTTAVARYEGCCSLCKEPTAPGDRIFAYCSVDERSVVFWAHGHCAHLLTPDGSFATPPCRHWVRLGKCPMHAAAQCVFAHDDELRGTVEAQTCCGGRRNAVRNDFRAGSFRNWLCESFGLELLQRGTVLDVGGGKGELSWELCNCVGVRAVVVDPRPLQLRALDKRWRKGHFEPKRLGPVFSRWNPAVQDGDSHRAAQHPMHWRSFFSASDSLSSHAWDGAEVQEWLDSCRRAARAVDWTSKGLQQHEDEACELEECIVDAEDARNGEQTILGSKQFESQVVDSAQIRDETVEEITGGDELRELLGDVCAVVGMHPDQGAGELAQYAVAMSLPWAVVPCCVYSKSFPKRKLRDGTQVTTHAELVSWLVELHSKAQTVVLDFEGKNVCVYVLPDDV